MSPIVGTRYKCLVRENFDLCAACEAAKSESYASVKMNEPQQRRMGCTGGGKWGRRMGGARFGLHAFEGPDESTSGAFRERHHRGHGHGHGSHSDSGREHHGGGGRGRGRGRGFMRGVLGAFEQHAGTVSELKAELERSFAKAAAGQQSNSDAPWRPWMEAAASVVNAVSGAAKKMERDHDTAATDESILQNVLKMSMQEAPAAAPAAAGDPKEAATVDIRAELERNFAAHACHASIPELQAELERAFGIRAPMTTIGKLQAELLRAASAGAGAAGAAAGDEDAEEVCMNVNPPEGSRLMCRYVRDLTYPDGTEVKSGSQFFKTWRLRNDGQTDWPLGCALQFSGGDDLTYVCNDLALAKAGQEVDVSVALIAPDAEGRYTVYFRVSAPDGRLFGQRFWADVRVVPSTDAAV